MHLEYQKLMKQHPELANRLDMMPGSVFSGRRRIAKGTRGVFFCFSLPALDREYGDFTLEAGIADSATWQEVAEHLEFDVPEGVNPDRPFISMIDPATGTGTFLVHWLRQANGRSPAPIRTRTGVNIWARGCCRRCTPLNSCSVHTRSPT